MQPLNQKHILADIELNSLPSPPSLLQKLFDLTQGANGSFHDISMLLTRDPSLSAKLISLARTTTDSSSDLCTLEKALLDVGPANTKLLIKSALIQQHFSDIESSESEFVQKQWQLSLRCALLCKSLAILTSYSSPEEAYTTGLLHNIGVIALSSNYGASYRALYTDEISAEERQVEERKKFLVSHNELGAWLAEKWGMSQFAIDAIEFHHAPIESLSGAHHLVKILYLASRLASETDPSTENDSFKSATQLFDLSTSLITEIVLKIHDETSQLAEQLASNHQDNSSVDQSVRDLSLSNLVSIDVARAQSKKELSTALKRGVDLLFGLHQAMIFWLDEETNELYKEQDEDTEHPPIKFKLEAEQSIVADVALRRKIQYSAPSDSDPKTMAVVDHEILRMVKAERIICMPVGTKEKLACVIVAGTDHTDAARNRLEPKLSSFCRDIAEACNDKLTQISDGGSAIETEHMFSRIHELVHEANNPLNIISNYLATLGEAFEDSNKVKEEITVLREEVERTGQILQQIKNLQDTTHVDPSGSDINQEITSLVTLYRSSVFDKKNISCSLDLDPEVSENSINRNHLRQILTNILKNANEAIELGGAINVKTSANINVSGQNFVEIMIEDNGPGITANVLDKLFSPVPSTKGSSHSGLGLSITRNLVNEANGSITCRSSSQGSVFQILLPA